MANEIILRETARVTRAPGGAGSAEGFPSFEEGISSACAPRIGGHQRQEPADRPLRRILNSFHDGCKLPALAIGLAVLAKTGDLVS